MKGSWNSFGFVFGLDGFSGALTLNKMLINDITTSSQVTFLSKLYRGGGNCEGGNKVGLREES